jgi:hypothetical protein
MDYEPRSRIQCTDKHHLIQVKMLTRKEKFGLAYASAGGKHNHAQAPQLSDMQESFIVDSGLANASGARCLPEVDASPPLPKGSATVSRTVHLHMYVDL